MTSEEEILQLRMLLCYKTTVLPYTDDGELQDNSEEPCIDFKRDWPSEIARKWKERLENRLASAGWHKNDS